MAAVISPNLSLTKTLAAAQSCVICYDNIAAGAPTHTTGECAHVTCGDCFRGFVEFCITSNRVPVIPCPVESCKAAFSPDYIIYKAGLFASTLQNYLLRSADLALMAEGTKLIYCPSKGCGSGFLVDLANAASSSASTDSTDPAPTCVITCWECNATFCIGCLTNHAGVTCHEFKTEVSNDTSLAFIQNFTKSCPNDKCLNPIQKNGGCNSMVCTRCQLNFCWQCLKPMGSTAHATCYNDMMRDEKALRKKMAEFTQRLAQQQKAANAEKRKVAQMSLQQIQSYLRRSKETEAVEYFDGTEMSSLFG